jgi:hypothetical protein
MLGSAGIFSQIIDLGTSEFKLSVLQPACYTHGTNRTQGWMEAYQVRTLCRREEILAYSGNPSKIPRSFSL